MNLKHRFFIDVFTRSLKKAEHRAYVEYVSKLCFKGDLHFRLSSYLAVCVSLGMWEAEDWRKESLFKTSVTLVRQTHSRALIRYRMSKIKQNNRIKRSSKMSWKKADSVSPVILHVLLPLQATTFWPNNMILHYDNKLKDWCYNWSFLIKRQESKMLQRNLRGSESLLTHPHVSSDT